jgi:crossover junction endodeoxyribonuclease RuvC
MLIKVMGIDPGLRFTGWGIISVDGNHIKHNANGVIKTNSEESLSNRLLELYNNITGIISDFKPDEASIENTFVNKNPLSSLKLGHARGAIMVAVANQSITCSEYAPNLIKKTIVGQGHADKTQVALMVSVLLSIKNLGSGDASDALAIAITHAHHRTNKLSKVLQNDR